MDYERRKANEAAAVVAPRLLAAVELALADLEGERDPAGHGLTLGERLQHRATLAVFALRDALGAVAKEKDRAAADVAARPGLDLGKPHPNLRCCDECVESRDTSCVCYLVTDCPVHGVRHHGTHD